MADYVRIEFEPAKTRKLIPKSKHIMAAAELASKRLERTVTINDLVNDWGGGWPYLIHALLREQTPDFTLNDACDLMDTYFETHAKDKDALKALGRGLGRALERYTSLEATPTPDEGDRPTPPASA